MRHQYVSTRAPHTHTRTLKYTRTHTTVLPTNCDLAYLVEVLLIGVELGGQVERLLGARPAVLDRERALLRAAEEELGEDQQILHVAQVVHLAQRALSAVRVSAG